MKLSKLAPVSLAAVALASLACGGSPTSSAPDTADAGASSSTPASSTHIGPTGSNCVPVTESYSICEDLSTCPGVVISQSQFPECGYSVHGAVIDPECLCFGSMCPMGAPETCAEMQTLLSSGITASIVCEQYAAGKCANEGNQGEPSTCQACKFNCDGNVTCLQNCGC